MSREVWNMNFAKKYYRSFQVLGVGAALLVPALAVGLEVPNSFTAGAPIRAVDVNENFRELAEEVTALREELDALKESLKPGTRVQLTQLDETNTSAIYQARSSGVILLFPAGTGYGNIATRITTGTAVADDDWTLLCGSTECQVGTRVLDGNANSLLVSAGEYVRVLQGGATGTGHARVHWQPLYGEDSANTAPRLIRTGTPPAPME